MLVAKSPDSKKLRRNLGHLAALVLLLGASQAHADEPSNFNANDGYPQVPGSVAPIEASRAGLPPAFISSREQGRNAPTFLWAIHDANTPPGKSFGGASLSSSTPERAARTHLEEHAGYYGVDTNALASLTTVQVLDLGHGGILVVFRQRVNGADLFHNDVKVMMTRSLDLVAIGGNIHPAGVASPKLAAFSVSPPQALATAFDDLFGQSLKASSFIDTKNTQGDYHYYGLASQAASAIVLTEPARIKRVYFPLPDRIVPAFMLEIIAGSPNARRSTSYSYVIAADDGRILYRENLTHSDVFNYRVFADDTGEKRPWDGPLLDYTPYPAAAPNGSYPGFREPLLVSIDGFNKTADPWLPTGATVSTGNNVDAYTDDDAPDGFSAGDTRATTTSAGTFDRTYDFTLGPQSSSDQKQASVTDLFYETNWLHDWWYDSGFDEQNGNAQKSNYGRGGVENDPLLAEGQNGAPAERNNSDMSVPGDGSSPRMQMLVWDGKPGQLTLGPSNQIFTEGGADFGATGFSTTGPAVLVDDGSGTVTDACQPIVGSLAGDIAVIDRGTCSFKTKVLGAQVAGAIGVVIVDNANNGNPPHLFDDPAVTTAITIPAVSVTLQNGNLIKTSIGAGPTTLTMVSSVDSDGTIDNSVIAHEWGHYLHLRHVACGSALCAAESEGWADFNAMMTIVREGDDLDGSYGLAQYAVGYLQNAAYFGIRRFPYSVDFGHDPLTFKDITEGQALPTTAPQSPSGGGDNTEAHAAGEIWASMLFEAYVSLLKNSQIANAPYTFTEARRRMGDYVVAGQTLAPADPTYLEQRDALLAAAAAADPNDLSLIAGGFARRGAGTCAESPTRDSTDFTGVVESFVVVPNLRIDTVTVDDKIMSCDNDGYVDSGEVGRVVVKATNNGPAAIPDATAVVTTTTPGILFPDGPTIDFGAIDVFGNATASIKIALDPSITHKTNVDLNIATATLGCADAQSDAFVVVQTDEVTASSTTDDVEEKATTWTTQNAKVWSRSEGTTGNHVWSGVDFPSPSDSSLTSPALDVSPTDDFVMTFSDRHSFEASMGTNWDGGVIEVSTDNGANWTDISKYGDPHYGGMIGDPTNGATNVLKGRQGYVATNASWPAADIITIDMGTMLAGKTVKVRFRIGSDNAVGNVGWLIDDMGFTGITNQPFGSLVDDKGACGGPNASSTTSGAGGAGTGGAGMGAGGGLADDDLTGGCNCNVSGSASDERGTLALFLLGLGVWVRGRRRRSH